MQYQIPGQANIIQEDCDQRRETTPHSQASRGRQNNRGKNQRSTAEKHQEREQGDEEKRRHKFHTISLRIMIFKVNKL